jgi:LuxR family maltose regulon positive regulatory protein
MLQEAEPLYLPGFFPDVRPIPAAAARVWVAQGRLADAWEWARRHRVGADDPVTYLAEFDQLTLARLFVAQHRADPASVAIRDAVGLLDRLLVEAEASDRHGSLVEVLVVRALAGDASGDRDAAVDDVGRAAAVGVPAGYCRLFLDEGPPMGDLLQAAARRPDAVGSVEAAALRRADDQNRNRTADDASPAPIGPESLSVREVEVLRLLATDLTGPEIASRLYLSVNTFRTHSRHIFTKLDVNTRRAAVARAADLGLL